MGRMQRIVVMVGVAVVALAQIAGDAAVIQSSVDRQARESQREEQQRVADVFKALAIAPGAVVADVGAGQGFYTVRLAKAVGDTGRVYAVDVSSSALRSLRGRVADEGLGNVEVLEGAVDDPKLPKGSLDAALIVNAYHEMTEHQKMLAHIRTALKPGGRLVILEPISSPLRDRGRSDQTRQHEIAPAFVQQEAKAAGFSVVELLDPFSSHHGHGGSEYLLVLTPDPSAASVPVAAPAAAATPADESSQRFERIAFDDFVALHKSSAVIVLDVRDEGSFSKGHIPTALHAPMSGLRDMLPALRKASQPIVAYCACPAEESSGRAIEYLRKNGVEGARALTGGYDAWVAAGKAIDKGSRE
jgi:FkbM family methyltransferase